MRQRSVQQLDLTGARVLLRADYDVPVYQNQILDDPRLVASLPTISLLRSAGARIAICSHRGHPEGRPSGDLSTHVLATHLSSLLGTDVATAPECIGEEVEAAIQSLVPGGVLLLENVRFHADEESNDPGFAAQLARLADVFVSDAFESLYQEHASVVGVPKHLPSAAGLLVEQELSSLEPVIANPERPLGLIVGGTNVERKLLLVEHLLPQLDVLCLGGLAGVTVLRAAGLRTPGPAVDTVTVERVERMLEAIRARPEFRLLLPATVVATDGRQAFSMSPAQVPEGFEIVDTGVATIRAFEEAVRPCRTIIWNGPMGAFQRSPFEFGTFETASLLSGMSARTIAAGGETASAIRRCGVWERFTHVSTGGATTLRLLAGIPVPGLDALPVE